MIKKSWHKHTLRLVCYLWNWVLYQSLAYLLAVTLTAMYLSLSLCK